MLQLGLSHGNGAAVMRDHGTDEGDIDIAGGAAGHHVGVHLVHAGHEVLMGWRRHVHRVCHWWRHRARTGQADRGQVRRSATMHPVILRQRRRTECERDKRHEGFPHRYLHLPVGPRYRVHLPIMARSSALSGGAGPHTGLRYW